MRQHRIGIGLYDRIGDALVLRERFDVEVGAEAVAVQADSSADLILPNEGDLTFAKVRLDERSLATALADVRRIDDPLARALVWASLWDTCRDGELPAAAFVEAVLANLEAEPDPAVVATLLSQARTAATLYTADGEALREELAAASWRSAQDAPRGQ